MTTETPLVFTPDEVAALTSYQSSPQMHPFTCLNRGDANHRGEGDLIPTVRGWICQYCDYRQDWAHPHMKAWR